MSHAPTANSQLRLVLLMILAATACGKSPPKQAAGDADSAAFVKAMENGDSASSPAVTVPKDLVPVALASAQSWCGTKGFTCKDYKISTEGTSHSQLTSADRANGYEDKWCVSISFVLKVASQPWQDHTYTGIYTEHSGAWQYLREAYVGCS